MPQEKGPMINATGMWLNKTKSGEAYFSGSMGGLKVMLFKNKFKKKDSQPDYQLVFGENKKKDAPQEAAVAAGGDEDVPF